MPTCTGFAIQHKTTCKHEHQYKLGYSFGRENIYIYIYIYFVFNIFVFSMVVWRDSFIMLGRNQYQKFNLTTQIWTSFSTSPPVLAQPVPGLYSPACMVLPSEEILVVGNRFNPNQTLVYNHVTNNWRTLPTTNAMQGNDINMHNGEFLIKLKVY